MKAITIRQPWASLIAAGTKTIETRPRRTAYRGRIAIHAGKAKPEQGAIVGQHIVDWGLDPALTAATSGTPHLGDGCGFILLDDELDSTPLPLGAVVGSAVLTDCVPIVDGDAARDAIYQGGSRRVEVLGDSLWLCTPNEAGNHPTPSDATDQLPYGDFTPGRWALLLDDIKPTTERCPWCWGSAFLNGGPPVHAVAPCPACGGIGKSSGRCDPIPARGQQAVPWEWTP